jgi:uncharacterized membrane protein YfcA
MTIVNILLSALTLCGLLLAVCWYLALCRVRPSDPGRGTPTLFEVLIGFVFNFFDTLGIGSMAPTTAVFRLFHLVPDELIPGTLLIGLALSVTTQALFFISVVSVDAWQLTALIVVCVLGGWIGAGVVSSLSRRAIQIGMGCALAAAATFMLLGMLGLIPAGGTALSLSPVALAVALAITFMLGALLTLGIGNYAPSLIMFSLLGMDPRAAFPIMAGAGAFVATIAGIRFINAGCLQWRTALGLTVGGIPGVIVAAWLVQSLPLETLRWMVLVVVSYASITLLRAGLRTPSDATAASALPARPPAQRVP